MVVAVSLKELWGSHTLNNKSGFAPGVDIIRGDTPTLEELSALRESQTAMFQWMILDANGKHLRGESTEITNLHRAAAKELLDKGAERLPWYPKIEYAAVKDCLACGKQIESRAKVCSECKINLVDWYLKYELDPTGDPVIAEFIYMLEQNKAQRKDKSKNN
jgi:hypothetical protein